MSEPISTGISIGAIFATPVFQTLRRELKRRQVDALEIDFGDLTQEMDEALSVLANNSDRIAKAFFDSVKGLISKPRIFQEETARQWIRTEKAQNLVKEAIETAVRNQDVEKLAVEASQFFAEFDDSADEKDGYVAFKTAVAYVVFSLTANLTNGDKMILSAIKGLSEDIKSQKNFSPEILDEAVKAELKNLRQGRFFIAFDIGAKAKQFQQRLLEGDLSFSSKTVRAKAIANCARWLCKDTDPQILAAWLAQSRALADTEEALIAEAFLDAKTSWQKGLAKLTPIETKKRKSAALFIQTFKRGGSSALEWFAKTGWVYQDLDADGKCHLLSLLIKTDKWDQAYDLVVGLTEQDFDITPALVQFAALVRMSNAIPPGMRKFATAGIPLSASDFPLQDKPAAIIDRREASRLYKLAGLIATKFGDDDFEEDSSLYSLWLELRDPEFSIQAKQDLIARLSSGEKAIAYVPLGLSFDIELRKEQIEKTLESRAAIKPEGTSKDAIARLSLAILQKTPEEIISYFEKHREIMLKNLNPNSVIGFEVQALLQNGLIDKAKELIVEHQQLMDASEIEQLLRKIQDVGQSPKIAQLEKNLEEDPSIINLKELVTQLAAQGYTQKLFELGCKLVLETDSHIEADKLVQFLANHSRHDEIGTLLDLIPDIIPASPNLRSANAWTLYRRGHFQEAQKQLDLLIAERDSRNDRALLAKLLISSGRWQELAVFVESEWSQREKREPEELLSAAKLSVKVQSSRTFGFLELAAERAGNDPHILLGCYSIAVESALEDNPKVSEWFATARENSNEKGPIQQVSLEDLVEKSPDWNRRTESTWETWKKGEVPISIAAELLRRSSLEIHLSYMIANRQQSDPRKRAAVPAFSGVRGDVTAIPQKIAFDGSSLVTLGSLGLIGETIDKIGPIHIPHSTLRWLYFEREKLAFHQPSRTKAAHELSRAISSKSILEFSVSAQPDNKLTDLIGRDLAAMLASAVADYDDDHQRIVVRSGPITKIGSFREEEVNLDEFVDAICSCQSVIDKLAERGKLTELEEKNARNYLSKLEKRWPNEPTIENGAHLYLDDLSVSYLRSTGVLYKLHGAGFSVYVSSREIDEANALIQLEGRSDEVEKIIEQIREPLALGMQNGSVIVDAEIEEDEIREHPNLAILQLAGKVDVAVCDDRYMSRHQHIGEGQEITEIWTSLDLLSYLRSKEKLDDADYWRFRTILRNSGYIHFPSSAEELIHFLAGTKFKDSELLENGELRAFRENISVAQTGGWLMLPLEHEWLKKLNHDIIKALVSQWDDKITDEDARARSNWLLARADMRNWAGQITEHDGIGIATLGFVLAINSLLIRSFDPKLSSSGVERFEAWLEEVLARLKTNEPKNYQWLIEHQRQIITTPLDKFEQIDV